MRLTRTMMLEVLRQDYVRVPGEGFARRRVIIRHALRNALIPIISLLGLRRDLSAAPSSSSRSSPGRGWACCCSTPSASATIRSSPASALIIGLSVMLINLAVDLSYGLLDPKVRYR